MTTKPSKVEKLLESFGMPAGRYSARLVSAELVEPTKNGKRGKQWQFELCAVVVRNGAKVVSRRPLAEGDDPYAVTSGQRRGLRDFAERLAVQSTGPVEEVVSAIRALAGTQVTAYVRPAKFGLQVTLSRPEGTVDDNHHQEVVAGEVIDLEPIVEPAYREKTLDAQGAHEMLLAGLRHANRGLALVSEACWRLKSDEGWVALGYDSVSSYLASPEVSLKRSQFYGFADIWQRYVLEGGIDEQRLIAPSKLEVPLVAIKSGDVTAEEALADAEMLGLRDLRQKYRGEPEDGKDKQSKSSSGRPDFPIVCAACGVVIEDEDGLISVEGIVYSNHRWPDAWSHDQIIAAVAAAEGVA